MSIKCLVQTVDVCRRPIVRPPCQLSRRCTSQTPLSPIVGAGCKPRSFNVQSPCCNPQVYLSFTDSSVPQSALLAVRCEARKTAPVKNARFWPVGRCWATMPVFFMQGAGLLAAFYNV